VGPRSAGADPGPVCYGRGGTKPTLTDSFLILGRLDSAGLLSGAMPLDAQEARQAVSATIASALDVSVERAALGAVELCVASVVRAVESITVAEGRDPRDYALVSAGGAGPMIACELAAAIDIGEVIVPPSPGSFSACGLLASDMRRDWIRTRIMPVAMERLGDVNKEFAEMEAAAREWLADTAAPGSRPVLLRSVAARYVGQDYELTLALATGALTGEGMAEMLASFHEAHEGRYGYALRDRPVEIVDLNVTAIRQLPSSRRQSRGTDRMSSSEKVRTREVYLGEREGWAPVRVHRRSSLQSADSIDGPAIIEQYDSTTYLPRRFRARVDQHENLRLTPSGAS
jgi:N-methylhydantoinase A